MVILLPNMGISLNCCYELAVIAGLGDTDFSS